MKLLTEKIVKQLPALYSTEKLDAKDQIVMAKFFDSRGSWTWYAVEGGPVCSGHSYFDCSLCGDVSTWKDFLFFGLVDGFEKELGYFSLSELESIPGIERDLYFDPVPLSKLMEVY